MCFLLIGAVGLFLSICFCKSDVTQCNATNYGNKDFAAGTSTQPSVCCDAANVCVSVIRSLTTSLRFLRWLSVSSCCCGSVDLTQETFDSSSAGGRLRRHGRRIRRRSALYFRNIFLLRAPWLLYFLLHLLLCVHRPHLSTPSPSGFSLPKQSRLIVDLHAAEADGSAVPNVCVFFFLRLRKKKT